MTQTFTFPSCSPVELPEGTPLCRGSEALTTCAAYNRASAVLRQRQEVAERERILIAARSAGHRIGRLAEWLEHHRRVLDRMLTWCVADPTPCTCEH